MTGRETYAVTMRERAGDGPAVGGLAVMAGAAAVFAVVMAGTTLPTPLYALYRQQIGFSELLVTVIFAVYAVGVIGVLAVAGNVSDTVGRRRVAMLGVAMAMVSALCFLVQGGLPLLFLGRLFSGLSAGLFTGAATAYVLELAPPGRRSGAALTATAANMGGLGMGPVLAGVLSQYAPWPLRLTFAVHLAMLAVSAVIVFALPETVPRPRPWSAVRVSRPAVPPAVRAVFAPSAVAVFVGFALLGVFTSVSPAFLGEYLGIDNRALVGLIVFAAFAGSASGQLLEGPVGAARSLTAGCWVLLAGMCCLAAALGAVSLPLLVCGAVVGGGGQGLSLRGSIDLVTAKAPAEDRAATVSALFLVAYTGISLPVVGIGVVAQFYGLRHAGLVFAVIMAVLATLAGIHLTRRHTVHPGG